MTTNGTSFLDLQPGDERAYDAMAQAVLEAILKLRARMEAEASAHPYQEITLEVFQSLIDQVDEFVEQCCGKSAKVMRQCALVPEVLGMPTTVLAREIRTEVFGPFDGYQKSWEGLKPDLEVFLAKLTDGSLPALERLRGLRLWRENSAKLLASMESSLRRFEQIPEQLLDFCCARCFGSQVSLDRQAKAVEAIQAKVAESLERAIHACSAGKHTEHEGSDQCESCGKADKGDGLDECAECRKILCGDCAEAGCCGHVPMRIASKQVNDEEVIVATERSTLAPLSETNPYLLYAAGLLFGSIPASDPQHGSVPWGIFIAILFIVPGVFLHVKRHERKRNELESCSLKQPRVARRKLRYRGCRFAYARLDRNYLFAARRLWLIHGMVGEEQIWRVRFP